MPYNVYRDESFDEPAWVKRVLPKNLTIGVLGFSFRYDPKEPLALLEIPGFLTAVKDQDRSPIAPPQRFERKTLSAPELEIHRAQESTRLIARTTGLDETYHLYLLHLDADWSGYDAGRYFTCLLKPDLDSGVPCKLFGVLARENVCDSVLGWARSPTEPRRLAPPTKGSRGLLDSPLGLDNVGTEAAGGVRAGRLDLQNLGCHGHGMRVK